MRNWCAIIAIAAASLLALPPGQSAQAQSGAETIQLAQKRSKKTRADRPPQRKESKAKVKPKSKESAPKDTKPSWRFSRTRGEPTLQYGLANETSVISFTCQPESGLVRVISTFAASGVKPGDRAAIRLTSGKKKFEIAGTAFANDKRDEIEVGGQTRIDPSLFGLFQGEEVLVVDVSGRRRELSIANAQASADAFRKACGAGASKQAG
jgi:hypothetical protein